MQFDWVAFTGQLLVGSFIGQGQDAVFIGIGTLVLDVVGFKQEGVSSVRIEYDLRAAVVGDDRDRFCRRRCRAAEVKRGSRDRIVTGQLITCT